jgi:hypothetical protein
VNQIKDISKKPGILDRLEACLKSELEAAGQLLLDD